MVRGLAAALVVAFLGVFFVPGASAGPLRTGFIDPLAFGSSDRADPSFIRARSAGASVVRLLLMWNEVAPHGRVKPTGFDAADPNSPAYNAAGWKRFDEQVVRARSHGLDPIVYIYGAPAWAEGSGSGNPGTVRPDPVEFGAFARAAAVRYSGTFVPSASPHAQPLPRVRYWQAWNEPNIRLFFNPHYENGRLVSPALYRAMVNSFAAAVRGVNPTNVVVAGGLAPIGSAGSVAPLTFMKAFLSQPVAFDVWAHHPYTWGGPTRKASGRNFVSLGNLPEMRKVLRAAARNGRVRSNGRVGFWVTEFSWDTRPPDPKGVPSALHARWTAEALYRMWKSGVSTVVWFKIQDDPLRATPHQSGFWTVGGQRKRSFMAFRFPTVAFAQRTGVFVWGRTPTSRGGTVVVERKVGRRWTRLGTVRAKASGIFQKKYRTPIRKGHVRARFARERSLPFSLTPVRDRYVKPFGCGGNIPC